MSFIYSGQKLLLQGLKLTPLKMVDSNEIIKSVVKRKQGVLLQLLASSLDQQPIHVSQGTVSEDLHSLLIEYADLFAKPQSLPPSRGHDHYIPIQEGSNPVALRPYRYPHFRKLKLTAKLQRCWAQASSGTTTVHTLHLHC